MLKPILSPNVWKSINCNNAHQVWFLLYFYSHCDDGGIVQRTQQHSEYLSSIGMTKIDFQQMEDNEMIYQIGKKHFFIPLYVTTMYETKKIAPNSRTYIYLKELLTGTKFETMLEYLKLKKELKIFGNYDQTEWKMLLEPEFTQYLKRIYKVIDVSLEIEKMHGWILDHPREVEKREAKNANWYSFAKNWLNKSNDTIGTRINKNSH